MKNQELGPSQTPSSASRPRPSEPWIPSSKAKLEDNVSRTYYLSTNETFNYNIEDFDSFGKVLEEIAVCKILNVV